MIAQPPETREWYVLRSGTVQGPFAAERVRRYLLLGRLRLSDRVSLDAVTWKPVTQWPELIPEEMRDLGTEAGRARFEAARRAVDERAVDREAPAAGSTEATLTDAAPVRPAPSRGRRRGGVLLLAFGGLAGLAALLATVGYYRDFEGGDMPAADCDAPDARVWNGCVKDGLQRPPGAALAGLRAINASLRGASLARANLHGARLDYADLTAADLAGADLGEAVLRGADLRRADLRDADLRRADLRNSDLRGARIEGAMLDGAQLGNALWIDGTACMADTVGRCR